MCSGYKVNLRTQLLLVVLQGAAVILMYHWYAQVKPVEAPLPKPKVHVLLLTSWRSGSTFMGQIFNHHPSVFYLSEPARHVWYTFPRHGKLTLRMAMRDQIRSMFLCDFSVMDSYLTRNPGVSSLFAWFRSRALCSPPACPVTLLDPLNVSQCRQKCVVQGLKKVDEACDIYGHVVFKIVRIYELESLFPLLEDPNLNLHIIHLVRDPRAVLRSREEIGAASWKDNPIVLEQRRVPPSEVQYAVMEEVCRGYVHINERATLNPPAFLKGRYKLVRFEDMTRNPIEEMNDLFEFLGLKMTTPLEEWLYGVTHGKDKGKKGFGISSRNATLVSEAWRTLLPYGKVKRIQEVCKGAMSLMGYKTVNSETEQKTLHTDLLTPRELCPFSRVSANKQNTSKT